MKIVNDKSNAKQFKDLAPIDIFTVYSEVVRSDIVNGLYVKINEINTEDCYYNAVCFLTGDAVCIDETTYVLKFDPTLTLNGLTI